MLYRLLLFLFLFWKPIAAYSQEELVTDFVFADFQLDNRKTGIELDLATRDYENYFLSIELFNQEFSANLSCVQEENRLVGMFWEGEIALDISSTAQEYFIEDEECYINISIVEQLDLKYLFDAQRQVFAVLTNGRHPKTQELKKAARKQMLEKLKDQKQSSMEVKDTYKLATLPALDIASQYRWQQNETSPSLFAQTVFDLLYHQADTQINWQKQGQIKGRAKLSRKIPWGGNRLHYQMGDIQESRQSLFDLPSRGLGISLGPRSSTGQRNNLDVSGYAQPQSEVELYKNNLLIDFIRLGDEGFYEFSNVDFQDQTAKYTLVITTPDGTKTKTAINAPGEHGLAKGEWSPALTLLDSSQSIFSSNNSYSSGKLASAEVNYALSNKELLNLGLAYTQQDESQSLFFGSAQGIDFYGVTIDAKAGYADTWLYNLDMETSLGKNHFALSLNKLSSNNLLSRSTNLSWARNWQYFTSNLAFSHNNDDSSSSNIYSAELGYRNDFWSMSLQGQQSYAALYSSVEDTLDNNSSNSKTIKSQTNHYNLILSTRGDWGNLNFSYRYTDGSFIQLQRAINANYSHYIWGMNTALTFQWDLEQNRKSTSIRLSKTFEHFKLNASSGYNDASGWSLGIGFSFGIFTQSPINSLTSSSVRKNSFISLKPFLDKNGNTLWDNDEPFLSQVNLIQKNRTLRKSVSDNSIKLFGVNAYDPKIYSIDDTELNNPFITPKYRDIKLESHPGGEIELNIPFYSHYEIEGEIQLLDKNNSPVERVGQLPLNLYKLNDDKSMELSRTYWSEPDGFYVLDKVKQGRYKLEIDPEFLIEQELSCTTCDFILNTDQAEDYILFANTFTLIEQQK